MTTFPLPSGPYVGMTQAQLQAALTRAQAALLDLATGGKPVSLAYAQGNGSKSVTFSAADEARLRQVIRELAQALGLAPRRRAIRPIFR